MEPVNIPVITVWALCNTRPDWLLYSVRNQRIIFSLCTQIYSAGFRNSNHVMSPITLSTTASHGDTTRPRPVITPHVHAG